MEKVRIESAFILGAGFSWHAGMPLQDGFTEALLTGRGEGTGASGKVVQFLRDFVRDAFHHSQDAHAKHWPELEDLFTCLDLSANSGHHLGINYPPAKLRVVRRALIYRIITMLAERYSEAKNVPDDKWRHLERYLKRLDLASSAFICTNWDTVLEARLSDLFKVGTFDYRCSAASAHFPSENDAKIPEAAQTGAQRIPVVKMHGSTNWLYCDNCRRILWFPAEQSVRVAGQLLRKRDWEIIDPEGQREIERYRCTRCQGDTLGTRLATFSYLKALDFPMFQKSWFSAEEILRAAKRWVFIGYSLPAADFEFKFLLKRLQLSRHRPVSFVVISGGSGADRAFWNYQRFFGRAIKKDETFFDLGLSDKRLRTH
jgi:RNase P subunit RPR2